MRLSKRMILGSMVALALMGGADLGVAGQQTGRTPPPLLIPSMAGGDLFRFYCASCHGREGKGDGPVASALNRRPPDLTTIARRNGGRFRPTASRRSSRATATDPRSRFADMPCGAIFRPWIRRTG
jgi:mono/diheme cytochrome c family protein